MFVNIVSNLLGTWFMPYGYALVFRQYGTQTPYFCRSKKFSKFVELVQYVIEERKDLRILPCIFGLFGTVEICFS